MKPVSIENQELVVAQFGKWPAFHDAEIVSVLFERAEPGFWPVISLRIYARARPGAAAPATHCLVELQFAGVREYQLEGFNHQNVVFSLTFEQEGELVSCAIEPSYGLYGYIAAERVMVKSVSILNGNPQQP